MEALEQIYKENKMWHSITNQNDIELFMQKINMFHDASIVDMHYKSGTYIEINEKILAQSTMNIIFKKSSSKPMKFEMELGLVDKFSINLHLDGSLEIYEATFKKKDDGFYWYSDEYANGNSSYWFRCQTIRWRELPLLESE